MNEDLYDSILRITGEPHCDDERMWYSDKHGHVNATNQSPALKVEYCDPITATDYSSQILREIRDIIGLVDGADIVRAIRKMNNALLESEDQVSKLKKHLNTMKVMSNSTYGLVRLGTVNHPQKPMEVNRLPTHLEFNDQ